MTYSSSLNGYASNLFLAIHIMDIYLNLDRKRFRYSSVDTAYSTTIICIKCKDSQQCNILQFDINDSTYSPTVTKVANVQAVSLYHPKFIY